MDNAISDAVKFTKPPDWGFQGWSVFLPIRLCNKKCVLFDRPSTCTIPRNLESGRFEKWVVCRFYLITRQLVLLRLRSHEASSMISNADKQGHFTFASLFVPIQRESENEIRSTKQIKSGFHIDCNRQEKSLFRIVHIVFCMLTFS